MLKRVIIVSSILLSFFVSFFFTYSLSPDSESDIFTGHFEFEDQGKNQDSEYYVGEELFGYLGDAAAIFLEYGFKDLHLRHITRDSEDREREIILEIYRMESPADAFGIFSVKRTGDEEASQRIYALNWVSKTQVNIVKAEYFVNIVCFKCEEEELEKFAAQVPPLILGKEELPPQINLLPLQNIISGSERYIRGQTAASRESVFLVKDFWGFKDSTWAVSSRYSSSNSKLIIIDFGEEKEPLTDMVKELFEEYLDEVEVKENIVKGEIPSGDYFLFSQKGSKGILVLGERDKEFARVLLEQALEKAKE